MTDLTDTEFSVTESDLLLGVFGNKIGFLEGE